MRGIPEDPLLNKGVQAGYCQCGCGERTNISVKTQGPKGPKKGQPFRFLKGHHRRISFEKRCKIEDRAFSTPCHIWQGPLHRSGYGNAGNGLAHRVFYERHKGKIPPGLDLHHLCKEKLCVNPDHLKPLSRREHALRTKDNAPVYAAVSREKVQEPYQTIDLGYGTLCWVWQRHVTRHGYGTIGSKLAHRVFYERYRGTIPQGYDIDHVCGVRSCVNPTHLEAVSRADNVRRGKSAKLTPDAVRQIRVSGENSHKLARRYGVHIKYISKVRSGRVWSDIS